MAQTEDSVSRAHDVFNNERRAWACIARHSAPRSRADAERPERHSHAERSSLYTSRDKRLERARLRPYKRTCPRKVNTSDEDAASANQYSRTSPLPLSDTAFLQVDLCITTSAERRNDQRDLKHADHTHACAQRYTRALLRPRTVGGGLPAMLFLKRPISD